MFCNVTLLNTGIKLAAAQTAAIMILLQNYLESFRNSAQHDRK